MEWFARGSSSSAAQRVDAEAAVWVVRLHGPARNRYMETAWRAWRAESPAHEAAWQRASGSWNESYEIPVELLNLKVPRIRNRRTRLVVGIAAAGICALVLAVSQLRLPNRTVYETRLGEQKVVELADGTRVELNTKTRLIVEYDRNVRRVTLESGEAYFGVAHEGRPFTVRVGVHKVVALGTSFIVRHTIREDPDFSVSLIEGRLAILQAEQPNSLAPTSAPDTTILKTGQRLKVHAGAPAEIDYPSMEHETGWMRGQMLFSHTRLLDAAEEFNRYSPVQLIVAPSAADLPVGGIFKVGDLESFARAVAESYDLIITRDEGRVILEPRAGRP